MNPRGLVLVLALCICATQAPAQDRNVQALIDRVERLERALNDVSRQVYRGEPTRAGSSGAAPAADSAGYAQLESRLVQDEEQIRRLTGQLEEVEFRVRQLTERLDKLVNDIDFRLGELERGRGGQPQDAAAPAGQAPQSQPQAAAPPGLIVGPQPLTPAPQPSASETPQSAAAPAGGAALPDGSPREQYDYAYGLLRKASFAEAEQAFREFLERNPEDKLAANAHYWLGETFYVREQYEQAALAFVEGYKKFPDGAKAPDTLYKLGLTLQRLNQKQESCATFAELLRRFPKADARMRERAEAGRKELACR